MGKRVIMLLFFGSFVSISACSEQNLDQYDQHAQNLVGTRLVAFDDLFFASRYKKLFDATMSLWGYVRMLHEGIAVCDELILVCDAIVGRITQVRVLADELLDACHHGLLILTDDIAYLADVFNCIYREYQSIVFNWSKTVEPCPDIHMEQIGLVRKKFIALMNE